MLLLRGAVKDKKSIKLRGGTVAQLRIVVLMFESLFFMDIPILME